jgi:cysteine desulfurase
MESCKFMIYADYNATTPIPQEVVEKMLPFLTTEFGNPSSTAHYLGQNAKKAIERARAEISSILGCKEQELVFTSGGTESCYHAIIGYLKSQNNTKTFIHSSVEHPAVLEAGNFASDLDLSNVLQLAINRKGVLDLNDLENKLSLHPGSLVSVMLANNETGILHPLKEIVALVKKYHGYVHTDAVQAAGKSAFLFSDLGVDFLSISAHKFGGPKGVGALVISEQIEEQQLWQPAIKGGGQESGRRGGTEAVSQIVGMHAALSLSSQLLKTEENILKQKRDQFEKILLSNLSAKNCRLEIIGENSPRLCNTSNFILAGINSQDIMKNLAQKDIVVSTGSACASGKHKPSRVLTNMGFSAIECLGVLRVSFGFATTTQEIALLANEIAEEVEKQNQTILAEIVKKEF